MTSKPLAMYQALEQFFLCCQLMVSDLRDGSLSFNTSNSKVKTEAFVTLFEDCQYRVVCAMAGPERLDRMKHLIKILRDTSRDDEATKLAERFANEVIDDLTKEDGVKRPSGTLSSDVLEEIGRKAAEKAIAEAAAKVKGKA